MICLIVNSCEPLIAKEDIPVRKVYLNRKSPKGEVEWYTGFLKKPIDAEVLTEGNLISAPDGERPVIVNRSAYGISYEIGDGYIHSFYKEIDDCDGLEAAVRLRKLGLEHIINDFTRRVMSDMFLNFPMPKISNRVSDVVKIGCKKIIETELRLTEGYNLDENFVIFSATVPKGSEYFVNETGSRICSKQIRIGKVLTEISTREYFLENIKASSAKVIKDLRKVNLPAKIESEEYLNALSDLIISASEEVLTEIKILNFFAKTSDCFWKYV